MMFMCYLMFSMFLKFADETLVFKTIVALYGILASILQDRMSPASPCMVAGEVHIPAPGPCIELPSILPTKHELQVSLRV